MALTRFGVAQNQLGEPSVALGREAGGSCGCREQQAKVRAKKCKLVCLGISIFNYILSLIMARTEHYCHSEIELLQDNSVKTLGQWPQH